jgi:hypothetical protein
VMGARSRCPATAGPSRRWPAAEGEARSRRGQAAGPGRLALRWAGALVLAELLAAGELAGLAGLLPVLVPEQAARPGTATAAMAQAVIRPGFMVSP